MPRAHTPVPLPESNYAWHIRDTERRSEELELCEALASSFALWLSHEQKPNSWDGPVHSHRDRFDPRLDGGRTALRQVWISDRGTVD